MSLLKMRHKVNHSFFNCKTYFTTKNQFYFTFFVAKIYQLSMKHKVTLFILLTVLITPLFSQSVNAPLNQDYYHLIDRYEIKNGKLATQFHSSFKGYQRSEIALFADSISTSSKSDQFNQAYLRNDNWEWVEGYDIKSDKPIFKNFYKKPSDAYSVNTKDFDLHVNPVLGLTLGSETESNERTFINTRGIQIRATIDNKVGFYTYIGENQAIFPQYVREYISTNRAVPNEGFWKRYNDNGVDYFTARGYISFNASKHINLQFGHDNFSVGNGYRSLILSDFAPAYTFLKLKTKVWKFNYTNLFTQMTADTRGNSGGTFGSNEFPKKYLAFHHLSLNIGKKLNIGVFESIIFGRPDSLGNNYQMKYLNPVIFYRAIEHQNGSSDNALLGLDFKWLALPKISLYGQLVLDEFLLENLKEGDGWWGNKYGIQLGGKYIDAFGVSNLDLQLEGNLVRPYNYSHQNIYTNYAHYRQPLAHPLGANFKEVIAIVRYQPIARLSFTGKFISATYGLDEANSNWGRNILKDYNTREQERGNEIGQGVSTTLTYIDFTASYQFKHNLLIYFKQVIRTQESSDVQFDQNTSFSSVSLRWNIPKRLHEF